MSIGAKWKPARNRRRAITMYHHNVRVKNPIGFPVRPKSRHLPEEGAASVKLILIVSEPKRARAVRRSERQTPSTNNPPPPCAIVSNTNTVIAVRVTG